MSRMARQLSSFHPWKTQSYLLAGTAKALPKPGIDMAGISYDILGLEAAHPCQMPTNQGPPLTPERRLFAAVLADALYLATRPYETVAVRQAREWFESEDRDFLFAFHTVCDALGFDASAIRRYLHALPQVPARFRLMVAGRNKRVTSGALLGRRPSRRGPYRFGP